MSPHRSTGRVRVVHLQAELRFSLLAEAAAIDEEGVEATLETVRVDVRKLEGKRVALVGLAYKPRPADRPG